MQKLRLSIVLALCMLLAVSAFATDATTGVQITAADATVVDGVADVVVTVDSGETALSGVMFSVSAPEGVTLQSWTSSVDEAVVEDDTTEVTAGWYISASDNQSRFGLINVTGDETLNETVTLTYAVAAEYAEDTAEITVTAIEAIKRDESAVDVTATGATITVKSEPACDHTPGEWTLVEGTDATYERACECGEATETHTHTFSDWVAVEGTNTHSRACADCEVPGNTETADHDIVVVDAKDATCTEAGWAAYEYCSKCDYTTKGDEIPAGHNYVKGDLVHATRDTDAYYTYTCDGCGDSYDEIVPTQEKEYTFKHNVLLESSYVMNFRIPVAEVYSADGQSLANSEVAAPIHWMEFVRYEHDDDGNIVPTTYIVDVATRTGTTASNGRYDFKAPAISSKQMNDKIEATYYTIINGLKYKSQVDTYNLVTYYNSQVSNYEKATNETTKATYKLLVDLLETMFNYGSIAQSWFGYNTTQDANNADYTGLVNLHIPEGNRLSKEEEYVALGIVANATRNEWNDTSDAGVYLEMTNNAADLAQEIAVISRYTLVDGSTEPLDAEAVKLMQFIGTYTTEEKGVEKVYDIVIPGSELEYTAPTSKYPAGRVTVKNNRAAAKDICCVVTGYLADADGDRISETVETSFECYATSQLASLTGENYANLRALLYATIHYAEQATYYFNNR